MPGETDHNQPKASRPAAQLRAILGGSGDCLPRVGLETLRRFHDYLAEPLGLPFEGRLSDPKGVPGRDTQRNPPIAVNGLLGG